MFDKCKTQSKLSGQVNDRLASPFARKHMINGEGGVMRCSFVNGFLRTIVVALSVADEIETGVASKATR